MAQALEAIGHICLTQRVSSLKVRFKSVAKHLQKLLVFLVECKQTPHILCDFDVVKLVHVGLNDLT